MATNKERIKALEAGLGGVQDGKQRLEKLSTGCLKFCFQLGKASTITTMGEKDFSGHIEKRTTTADKFFLPKWKNWNSQNTLELIQQNGSTG